MLARLQALVQRKPSTNPPKGLFSAEFLATLGRDHPYTPDYHALCLKRKLLVFLADETKLGHRGELDKDYGKRYGAAFTEDPYLMFRTSLGKFTFPVIMPKTPDVSRVGILSRATPGAIKGELWEMTPGGVIALDNFKRNGDTFTRQWVKITIPHRTKLERSYVMHRGNGGNINEAIEGIEYMFSEKQEHVVDALMYLADPQRFFWEAQGNTNFKSMKLRIPSDKMLKPYYEFADVNGLEHHQPHQPNMVPQIRIAPDQMGLKQALVKKFLTHPEFMEKQRLRNMANDKNKK